MFSMLAKGKQGVTKIDSASVRSSRHTDALTAAPPCMYRARGGPPQSDCASKHGRSLIHNKPTNAAQEVRAFRALVNGWFARPLATNGCLK
jgi:hypothetical protein